MKVKVLLPFSDKYNLARTFNPGEVVDFEDKRANDIVTRGLGAFEETKEPYQKPTAEKPGEKVEEPPVAESVETPIADAAPVAEKVEESIAEAVKVEESAEPAESEEQAGKSAEEKVEKKRPGRKPKNAE